MEHPVVLFDGICNFCDGVVNWLIRHDRSRQLRFASLQSEAGKRLLAQYGLTDTESMVLIAGGKAYRRSAAALRLLSFLPWWLQEVRVLWVVPRPFRDAIYDTIARNRYRLFGKRDACMIPTAEQRSRFLE
jgi:predicted DCC family thiol-disulfide oxidoreductase YuxK